MQDILLICVLIAFFAIGYYEIEKADQVIENNKKPRRILVIYDDDYKYMQDYSNDETVCLEKKEIWDLSEHFHSIVICTIDDYYNLLMNYRIQKSIQKCDVYAICHEQEYFNLYKKENIHILQTKEDLKELMVRLYGKNMETSN